MMLRRPTTLALCCLGCGALLAAAPRTATPAPTPVLSDATNATAILSPGGFTVNASVLIPDTCWNVAMQPYGSASASAPPHAFQAVRTQMPPRKGATCDPVSAYVPAPPLVVRDPAPPASITLVTSQGTQTIPVTATPPG
jgi:hypothetical protein